jgi:hypothetical protein
VSLVATSLLSGAQAIAEMFPVPLMTPRVDAGDRSGSCPVKKKTTPIAASKNRGSLVGNPDNFTGYAVSRKSLSSQLGVGSLGVVHRRSMIITSSERKRETEKDRPGARSERIRKVGR